MNTLVLFELYHEWNICFTIFYRILSGSEKIGKIFRTVELDKKWLWRRHLVSLRFSSAIDSSPLNLFIRPRPHAVKDGKKSWNIIFQHNFFLIQYRGIIDMFCVVTNLNFWEIVMNFEMLGRTVKKIFSVSSSWKKVDFTTRAKVIIFEFSFKIIVCLKITML